MKEKHSLTYSLRTFFLQIRLLVCYTFVDVCIRTFGDSFLNWKDVVPFFQCSSKA